MIYRTDNIIIRPFTKNDVTEKYRNWFQDPEVTKFNAHGLGPMTDEAVQGFIDNLYKNKIVWAIGEDESSHIGNVSLQSINYINRSAEFAIVIGEKLSWEKGIATEVGKLVLAHGFNKLGLHRIWTGTAAVNRGMRKVASNMGMMHEGTFKDGMYLHGRFEDIHCYSILDEDWKSGNWKSGIRDDMSNR